MKHIAMIGAGISGLMSALELLEQGCSVSILISSNPVRQPPGPVVVFSLQCIRGVIRLR